MGTIFDGDMVADRWGSGLEGGGWGLSWRTADSSGSRCCRSKGPGGGFEAGRTVVVVDDVVGVVDGGCACIARGDVAALEKVSTRVCVAVSAVWGVA